MLLWWVLGLRDRHLTRSRWHRERSGTGVSAADCNGKRWGLGRVSSLIARLKEDQEKGQPALLCSASQRHAGGQQSTSRPVNGPPRVEMVPPQIVASDQRGSHGHDEHGAVRSAEALERGSWSHGAWTRGRPREMRCGVARHEDIRV